MPAMAASLKRIPVRGARGLLVARASPTARGRSGSKEAPRGYRPKRAAPPAWRGAEAQRVPAAAARQVLAVRSPGGALEAYRGLAEPASEVVAELALEAVAELASEAVAELASEAVAELASEVVAERVRVAVLAGSREAVASRRGEREAERSAGRGRRGPPEQRQAAGAPAAVILPFPAVPAAMPRAAWWARHAP